MLWFTKYPVENLLILSSAVFCFGIYTIVTRKNAVSILMGVELVLNSVNLNFITFSQFVDNAGISGNMVAIFVIVLAAAEASVALAIILGIYQNFGRVDVDKLTSLRN
ncbi:MAG: NADH-quinone oxidoreductase subunit NuoK [Planctomycetes bacterium]|nr:NADH-quinone oxidoreductase subunit NuoK [Planctomycetota bacterium]